MKPETLTQFYTDNITNSDTPQNISNGIGHFNVFRLEDCLLPGKQVKYTRRDYYKISLIRGNILYHYADKSIEISGTTLMFFNPQVPYTWETISGDTTGCFCIFTESFFTEGMRGALNELPMFTVGSKPSYILNKTQEDAVMATFEKMLTEINSDYTFKYDLLRSYLNEIIHLALKTEPAENLYEHPNANSRTTAIFKELLERQFPIETPAQRFTMRSASDFATSLSIHVNHLNRAVKHTTGKTTTVLIGERIIAEAKALLKHTDWNISEIGRSLGFEEAAHFNNFFKKQTSTIPSHYRSV
ncbi:AraC family transcriptional regulator [Flavobacterium arcticum]|uniref:AraC family transcriptional regulator n=1 Tax=Flavobacterium arcticum TaxID=1784713 RepID=A0A345H934_9FLAO|nr:helix-turn-helix domain-containing protein [Flavobacterium arcticum]AXG73094.1 AraC family transcriptional regulator [Flavobacterium arcticum]KAF2512885.1 AraC family transcriptional regulator [Flavobacterium arcticum]